MSTLDKQKLPDCSSPSSSNGSKFESPFSLNFSASSGQAVAPSPSGFASVAAASDAPPGIQPVSEEPPLPLDQVPALVKLLRRTLRQPERKLVNDVDTVRQLIQLAHCQPVVTLNAMEDVARLNAKDALNRILCSIARQPLISFGHCSDFVQLACREYKAVCDLAASQAPVTSGLEAEHLVAMGLTWRLMCEHSYECVLYSHESVRAMQPILLDKLRPAPDGPDSELEPLKRYLILDSEMRRVRCQWEEAKPALDRWRAANKPPRDIPWPTDTCAMNADEYSLGSAPGPFVTCERCSQTICTCPNCIMSHYISCGVLAPRRALDGTGGLEYNDDEDEFEENFMALGRPKSASPAKQSSSAACTPVKQPCEHCGQNKSSHQHYHQHHHQAGQATQASTQTASPAAPGGAAAAPVSAGFHANRDRLRQKLKKRQKQQPEQNKQQQQQQQKQQEKSASDIDELVRFIEGPVANSNNNNNNSNNHSSNGQAKGKRQAKSKQLSTSTTASATSSSATATPASVSSDANRRNVDRVFLPRGAAGSSASAPAAQSKRQSATSKQLDLADSDESADFLDEFVGTSDEEYDSNEPDPIVEQFKSFVLNSPIPNAQRQRVSCLDMQSLTQQMTSARPSSAAAERQVDGQCNSPNGGN